MTHTKSDYKKKKLKKYDVAIDYWSVRKLLTPSFTQTLPKMPFPDNLNYLKNNTKNWNTIKESQNTAINVFYKRHVIFAEHSYRPGREVEDESGWHVAYNNTINDMSYAQLPKNGTRLWCNDMSCNVRILRRPVVQML